MDWNTLPEEMEELILMNLPLVALQRVSSTRKIFEAAFRKKLALEQKACCNRAAVVFGPARIKRLAELIDSFVKGETLEAYLANITPSSLYRIREDGTCHKERPTFRLPSDGAVHNVGMWVQVKSCGFHMWMFAPSRSHMDLHVLGDAMNHSFIFPSNADRDEGVALLQALSNEGLVQGLHDAGQQLTISICRPLVTSEFTIERYQALIAPVLPLISPLLSSGRKLLTSTGMVYGRM